ncbi:hypothetical protein AR9_g111 [Bacillus phage AR9]|uniref:Uncharacterized protein n=2 Tax=Bacillus phage PBS1 TaxID=10683 RepID=A0A172JI07_BPPB1|nr:hypothetical protein BI022_gp110 [Bacillus phage AR9]YP_009664508.1 hypothetical protein FK780_gp140 [Bacillus phage PBS1]AMS01195.1 hypothetical protein AR9_g111 [Bacillus phage AR9]ASU00129.1 hypothetical protein PBI_PBS1_307 [Bacillus phage PBS1]BDE75362.1 hypothetical protein [Bacillus phage PBS1]
MYKNAKDLRAVALKKLDLRLNEIIDEFIFPALNDAADKGKMSIKFSKNNYYDFLKDSDDYEKFQLIFENQKLFKEKLSEFGLTFIDDSTSNSITVSWQ